jgi:hypothetical protein
MTSALGRGNAAHANYHGYANAAPNSQVGKLAAYRDAVEATEAAALAAAAAEADLPGLEAALGAALDAQVLADQALADSIVSAIDVNIATAQTAASAAAQAVADAQQAIDDANADIAALGVAAATEQTALEASVKDPTYPGIAEALQDLFGL